MPKNSAPRKQPAPKPEMWKPAPSLNPSPTVVQFAAEGQPECVAIIDAWAFREPVKQLSREEYAALIERCSVSFGG